MVSAGAPRSSSSLSRPTTLGVRSGTTTATYANNWRNELSQDSRKKIINKIMDTLQKHMPFTGPDGMNELKKIALRFEEEIYAAAVDQQDYLWKISLKMLPLGNHVSRDANSLAGGSSGNQKPMDSGLLMQTQMRNASHSPTIVGSNGIPLPGQPQTQRLLDEPMTSVESSGQTGQSNAMDSQEKIYQKLQRLKEMYFPDLTELLQRLSSKCQQPMAPDQHDKLKLYKLKVERMMQYFKVSKLSIPPNFPEDKLDAVEKQIQSVLNSFKPRKAALRQQQGHQQFLPQSGNHLHSRG